MKRIMKVFFCLFLAMLMLSACGSPAQSTAQKAGLYRSVETNANEPPLVLDSEIKDAVTELVSPLCKYYGIQKFDVPLVYFFCHDLLDRRIYYAIVEIDSNKNRVSSIAHMCNDVKDISQDNIAGKLSSDLPDDVLINIKVASTETGAYLLKEKGDGTFSLYTGDDVVFSKKTWEEIDAME